MSARVLVVDDNAENRALAEATLEDDGYEVIVAADGAAGIAMFERERPDCILLDVQMPVLDGVTTCERIRALPGGGNVAIVFVTAQRDITTFDRALAAGGDDFITKPFRPNDLVVRVQTALRIRRLAGERSELYAEVKRQRDDLQRLQLQKDQLASFLVHDLKNPVNSIQLQAERVLRDPNASERSRSAGSAIRSEARSLMRMILDLLDVSRADEGRLSLARLRFPLGEEVAAVIDELTLTAAATDVTLVNRATIQITADRDLLHRVLVNLVENAIRHAPEGSTVRITGEAAATGGVELRVIDGGPGVPEVQRASVFDRFHSTGGTRNRGLGLAFCKLVVEAHGGEVWIEDAAPGAAFCVRLPDVPG
ncbi:MAG TPA: hybrid sensor histidine kinase/response regulator [Kofleriaceae bacterium]|nr:hybrid sensor histidine kinase/response regulator [Kofleriaceae bacterium]